MAARRPDPAAAPVKLVSPAPIADATGLAALLQYEGDLRREQSVEELVYFVANESRRVVEYDQMFVLRQARLGDGFHILCVSSMATVDRNAPLIRSIESGIGKLELKGGLSDARPLLTPDLGNDPALEEYPFGRFHWQPLTDRAGATFAGLLFAREAAFSGNDAFRIGRIAETASHSWLALTGDKPVKKIGRFGPKERKGALIAAALIAIFPVRMSALAPAEIVAERPFVIAAPFSGVVSQIHVSPNARVKKGEPLVSFDDVKLSNELKLAQERLAVAKARADQATSTAFGETAETREIGTAQAEYELAGAEYDYAREVMAKSRIVAPRDGIAVFSDRRDWEGRAVNVGDPMIEVADPDKVVIRIDLPTAEQMEIQRNAEVKLWLDVQPLWAIEARVDNASYQARETPAGVLAFAVTAKPVSSIPRIGSRGTAQLYGQWVPLAYSIFKRPIASLRQFFGI